MKGRKIRLNEKVAMTKHCKSIFSKAIGLMFSFPKDRALVFHFNKEKLVDLHMFFVFYPIDVFYLDASKKVTAVKNNFIQFTVTWPRKAKYVIEAKKGLLDIKVGDVVEF
ncbi:MAG: DUF192 domain-containing protein [Candidatus Woesearchaeota archaeon]